MRTVASSECFAGNALGYKRSFPFSSLIRGLFTDLHPSYLRLLNFPGKPRTRGFDRSITSRYPVITLTQNPLKLICIYRESTASISRRIASFYSLSNLTHTCSNLIKISRYSLSSSAIFIT